MNIILGLFSAITVFWLSALNWRASIKAVMVVLLLEGVIRKWILPQASEAVYFLKDGILLGAYFSAFSQGAWKEGLRLVSDPLKILAAGLAIFVLLQTLNPSLGSVIVGLLGAKSFLFYIPICLLLPTLFRNQEELHRFLRWYLLLAIPVCALGAMQFYAPADSPINMYAESASEMLGGDERAAETFGEEGNVRVTSTFPFLWGYSTYLTAIASLMIAMLVHRRNWIWRVFGALELLLLIANLFMTGARSLVFSVAAIALAFAFFSLFERGRNQKLVVTMIVVALAAVPLTLQFFNKPLEAFFNRTETAEDTFFERTLAPLVVEPWKNLSVAGIGGFGPASTQAASYVLRQRLSLGPPTAYPPYSEYEPLRTLLELGPLGLLSWYALKICVAVALFQTCRKLRTPLLRHLALGAFMVDFLWLFTNSLVFNPTCGILYWFLAGFAFALPGLDHAATQAVAPRKKRSKPPLFPSPLLPQARSISAAGRPGAILR